MNQLPKEVALHPFNILETRSIAAGYERSFKMSSQQLLSNRYLLGFDITRLGKAKCLSICTEMQMPKALMKQFSSSWQGASGMLIGYEQGQNHSTLKVYLEYWDQIRAHKNSLPDVDQSQHSLLHRGYKWFAENPEVSRVTDYCLMNNRSLTAIQAQMQNCYPDSTLDVGLNEGLQIVDLAFAQSPNTDWVFLRIHEEGNIRNSFDINLYPASMKISDIDTPLRRLANRFEIEEAKFDRLMSLVSSKVLGHISAGSDGLGKPYFTVYYEQ